MIASVVQQFLSCSQWILAVYEVCVWVVFVVYGDTNLFNDMGMTEVLQFEGGL